MTDMDHRKSTVFGARFMLAMLLATFAGFAQEASDIDELEPAVNTSEPIVVDERDALEPAVATAVPAEDIVRQESGGQVMDRIELGRTEITGNSELPTVLYIVPWQKPDPGDLMGKPVNTLMDEVLAPLDRAEFMREVGFYDDLYGETEIEVVEE